MSLDAFMAGRYSNAFNSVDTGIEEDGIELQQDVHSEVINQSDAFGQSIIDWLYQGGSCAFQYTSLAFKPGSVAAYWPYGFNTAGGALGVLYNSAPGAGTPVPVGTLASDLAKATVLTAVANTPATGAGGGSTGTVINTLTATKSLLAPNFPTRLLFNSKLRKLPLRMQALPYSSGSSILWYVTT